MSCSEKFYLKGTMAHMSVVGGDKVQTKAYLAKALARKACKDISGDDNHGSTNNNRNNNSNGNRVLDVLGTSSHKQALWSSISLEP